MALVADSFRRVFARTPAEPPPENQPGHSSGATEDLKKILLGEQGTVFDGQTLFRLPATGEVPDYSIPTTRDLRHMIQTETQMRGLSSAIRLPLQSAKWEIHPADDDKGEAEDVRKMLSRSPREEGLQTPMELVLGQMATATWMRKAYFEQVWARGKNGVYLQKLAFREPLGCRIIADEQGNLQGFWQYATGKGRIPFTGNKAFVYIHGQNEMPLNGVSIFDAAYQEYKNKQKVKFLTFEFLQEVSFPRRNGQYTGTDLPGLKAYAKKLANWERKGVLVRSADELLEAYQPNRTTDLYSTILDYLDAQMARSVLVQFLQLGTMGRGSRGSQSLSVDQTDFYLKSMEAVLTDEAAAFTNGPISDYVYAKYGNAAAFPTLGFAPLQDDKKSVIVDAWTQALSKRDSLPKAMLEQIDEHFASTAGLELPDGWEAEQVPVGRSIPGGAATPGASGAAQANAPASRGNMDALTQAAQAIQDRLGSG